ncbi:MAG TPA: hypothetical protein PKX87_00235 [Alphaproteobacteria bacterium]|nr:hypothetical protein [Alphaproteobacteria bacterium]
MPEIFESLIQRNARVEAEKAWETSLTRRLSIAGLTYLIAALYMKWGLNVEPAALHAAVPAGGYLLSTLSLGKIRTKWMSSVYRDRAGLNSSGKD